MRHLPASLISSASAAVLLLGFLACSDDSGGTSIPLGNGGTAGQGGSLDGGGGVAGSQSGSGGTDASAGGGGTAGQAGNGGTAGAGGGESCVETSAPGTCPVTFSYNPGGSVSSVAVAGEWQGFDLATAPKMTGPDAQGNYTVTTQLAPGLHAYKLVVNGTDWSLDPKQARRKYVGGTENSGVKVADCSLPSLTVTASTPARPSAGAGTYDATAAYHDSTDGCGPDLAGFEAKLLHGSSTTDLTSSQVTVDATGNVSVHLTGLEDGKYRVVLRPRAKNGKLGEPVRLVFWIEAEAFSWKDAVVYMALTDRYRDGDAANNAPPTTGADPRGDWQGGDLQGLAQSISEGVLDKLGVRAIWITPFQTNPADAYLASDGQHMVTGYHGYWPTKGRQVDPRIGGEAGLKQVVQEAHKHGIRILQDYVLNHVHKDHEYFLAHPEWFRDGCVCQSGGNCDWTEHALDCKFAAYLPDINHTVPECNAQFVADAVYWLDEFDLDGLRVDAVKHVEEVATRNLAAEVRETFEPGGTRYFLMGETAMGWSDCGCDQSCNDGNYGTISKYVGPYGLDGQFDFVLYHGVSYSTFAYGDKGMIHADYWTKCSQQKFGSAVMTPYIGSHDTARFATLSDYRGQDGAHPRSTASNQWDNIAQAPGESYPYENLRIGMAWLLSLPGAPLLYYGDEYGQYGGVDPNNRLMWRNESGLSSDEAATLAFVRKVGRARADVPALRRGQYASLMNTSEDTLVFARYVSPGVAAIVGLTRLSTPQSVSVEVANALGFASGTVLHDKLGGPDVTVAAGQAQLQIPARSAVILAP